MTTVTWGDSIKIPVTFNNEAGAPNDLDAAPTVKLFNSINEEIANVGAATKVPSTTGEYEIVFTVPANHHKIIHEWTGTMAGRPIVQRYELLTTWAS